MPNKEKHLDLSEKPDVLRRQSTLRPRTVEQFVSSLLVYLNSPPSLYRRRHPASNKVGCPFRYKGESTVKTNLVITMQSPGKLPQEQQPKGEATLTKIEKDTFVTPTRSGEYTPKSGDVCIITPGRHRTRMQVVEQCSKPKVKRVLNFENVGIQSVTVNLTYKHLDEPVQGKRIDNKRAHGGESADQRVMLAMQRFYGQLATKGVITPHEYTHAIAGHWGVVKEQGTGNTRDPSAATSTFVAPAAFNTEMILFERFADFLVFINHHRHGYAKTRPSVEYKMAYQQDPETLAISFAEIAITDLRTQIIFTERWDNPSDITEKPEARLFETMIVFLKKTLDRTLATELVPIPVLFSDGPVKIQVTLAPPEPRKEERPTLG